MNGGYRSRGGGKENVGEIGRGKGNRLNGENERDGLEQR